MKNSEGSSEQEPRSLQEHVQDFVEKLENYVEHSGIVEISIAICERTSNPAKTAENLRNISRTGVLLSASIMATHEGTVAVAGGVAGACLALSSGIFAKAAQVLSRTENQADKHNE